MIGVYTGAATIQVNVEVSLRIKIQLPHDPATPLLHIPKELKAPIQRYLYNQVWSFSTDHGNSGNGTSLDVGQLMDRQYTRSTYTKWDIQNGISFCH